MLLSPKALHRLRTRKILNNSSYRGDSNVENRIAYYNRLNKKESLAESAILLKDFKLANYNSAYFFDTYEFTRFFNSRLKVDFLFGDITFVPEHPSILKSRPIANNIENSVLLNLDKLRHFNFIIDRKLFQEKIDMLVWRGHISIQKPERIAFLTKFFNHPLCNIGNSNIWKDNDSWRREKMTIGQQLEYKFILCLEGVDVATNLKWVMSSNSVPVMPRPRFETWFMEGTLRPGYHYVEIRDDFSDFEEKLAYYNQHPKEAERIVAQAHSHVRQFLDSDWECYLALKVLERYFLMTGQQIFNI